MKKTLTVSPNARLRKALIERWGTLAAAAEAFKRVPNFWAGYVKEGGNWPGQEIQQWLVKEGININWLLTGEGAMLSGATVPDSDHPPASVAEPTQHYQGTGIPHLGTAMAGFPDSVLNTAKNELLEVDSDRVSITIDTADGRHIILIANRPKRT